MYLLPTIRVRKGASQALLAVLLFCTSAPCRAGVPLFRKSKAPVGLNELLSHMDETAKRLKTLSANLEYTKVTLVVNDKSTELGQLLFHRSKDSEILIQFNKPDAKTILFRKNKAEIYYPKINQIQEYDLEERKGLIQQFLLLGFGTEAGHLKKAYELKLLGEEELDGDAVMVLELTPRKKEISAQLSKVQLWISEESWLPVQQKFFEPSNDYLITRYTAVKVNRALPASTFRIKPEPGVKRVRMK